MLITSLTQSAPASAWFCISLAEVARAPSPLSGLNKAMVQGGFAAYLAEKSTVKIRSRYAIMPLRRCCRLHRKRTRSLSSKAGEWGNWRRRAKFSLGLFH
jgi:hypothetical protein